MDKISKLIEKLNKLITLKRNNNKHICKTYGI